MRVYFSGKRVGKRRRELLREAAEYFARYVLSRRMTPKIVLTIRLEPDLLRATDQFGYCETVALDDERNPRKFVVALDAGLTEKKTLLTLAHEMVHVKQFATGELRELTRGPEPWSWMGRRLDPAKKYQVEQDSPWEVEALGREQTMYEFFRDHLRLVGPVRRKRRRRSVT